MLPFGFLDGEKRVVPVFPDRGRGTRFGDAGNTRYLCRAKLSRLIVVGADNAMCDLWLVLEEVLRAAGLV